MSVSNEMEKGNNIEALFQQGELELALSAVAEEVKKNPNDEKSRTLFVELLCVSNEFERADAQLNALMTLQPDLGLAAATWRHLIHAAQKRVDVFSLKAKPELIEEPTPSIELALDLLLAINEGDNTRVSQLAENIDTVSKGNHFFIEDDEALLLRDLDDINANILEVMGTNGKYFWVDFSQVVELELLQPERILDLIWRKAKILLTNGTEGEVYIPAIYPTIDDAAAALGRKTEWQESGAIYRGVGLRTWLYGDDEFSINDRKSVLLKNSAHAESTNEIV